MAVRIPWATLVIPTYGPGGVDLVNQCLLSFYAAHPQTEPEIFVVSDGDGPEVLSDLAEVCDTHHAQLIANPRGGFAKACNAGIKRANGAVVWLVNNDIEFIEPSLLIMGDAVRRFSAGIMGCKLLYPDRTIQHAGVTYVPRPGQAGYFDHRLRGQHEQHPDALRAYPSLVTGALFGITRWYIDVVGGLDERFGFAVEDIDACLMCFEGGRDVIYFGYTQAIHHEGRTRGRTPEEKMERFPELAQAENQALAALQAKWVGMQWESFQ